MTTESAPGTTPRRAAETTLRLDGRTAVITGAAGTIGSALSAGFSANGANVIMVDRDTAGMARVAETIAGTPKQITCDITDPDSIDEMARTVVDAFGRIDILINNAGGNRRRLPHELTFDDWSDVTELNLTGCFLMSQRVGREMLRQGAGSIINISSTCGCSAMGRGNFVFSVSKAGVNHLTRELAVEWGASGVRVNAIAPSQVDSPSMRDWMAEPGPDGRTMGEIFEGGVPLGRLVTPEDLIGPALFLASDAAAMITGLIMPVDGGNLTANAAGTIGRPITI